MAADDVAHEIAQQRGAVRGVHDLEMELGCVELAALVGDRGDRRVRRGGDRVEAVGRLGHPVAVAHPHRVALARPPHTLEQRAGLRDLDLGTAELAVVAALDPAAELLRHGLLAVADAEHRDARLIDRFRRERRVTIEHRGRSARQDHAFRPHRRERAFGLLERHDLGINPLLAHAPRDQLRHLGAEIDDEDLVVHGAPLVYPTDPLRTTGIDPTAARSGLVQRIGARVKCRAGLR